MIQNCKNTLTTNNRKKRVKHIPWFIWIVEMLISFIEFNGYLLWFGVAFSFNIYQTYPTRVRRKYVPEELIPSGRALNLLLPMCVPASSWTAPSDHLFRGSWDLSRTTSLRLCRLSNVSSWSLVLQLADCRWTRAVLNKRRWRRRNVRRISPPPTTMNKRWINSWWRTANVRDQWKKTLLDIRVGWGQGL